MRVRGWFTLIRGIEVLELKRHSRGLAYCRYKGKCHYFGKYGTDESVERFETWLATLEEKPEPKKEPSPVKVISLCAAFMKYAEIHYRKDGEPTGEADNVRQALRKLSVLFGNVPVAQFGPKSLKAVRDALVKDGLARTTVNARVNRIRRVFKWGVSEQMVPLLTWQSLTSVLGLEAGRTKAKEPEPVEPVPELDILAVKPYVEGPVWGMIQFGVHTGARPGETVRLRWCDIDAEQEVWQYRPGRHKTEHRQKKRVILIGPVLQKLLLKLGGSDQDYVFRPTEAPGAGDNVGERYSTESYRTAVIRACERAFGCPAGLRVDHGRKPYSGEDKKEFQIRRQKACEWRQGHAWTPAQLRHNYATNVRRDSEKGLEAAQVGLGHSDIKTTQRYAEPNMDAAIEYARQFG